MKKKKIKISKILVKTYLSIVNFNLNIVNLKLLKNNYNSSNLRQYVKIKNLSSFGKSNYLNKFKRICIHNSKFKNNFKFLKLNRFTIKKCLTNNYATNLKLTSW